LEFAPPKVSGSIPSGVNFGGLSPQVGGEIGSLRLVGS